MVRMGNLSQEEGQKLADELKRKSESAKEELETKISAAVHKATEKLNFASRTDLERLENRIADLEKQNKSNK